MAKTPVKLEIDGYKEREVLMVTYEFDQATDVEGQMSGIPRGGKIKIRVKAHNDGTPDLLAWLSRIHSRLTLTTSIWLRKSSHRSS